MGLYGPSRRILVEPMRVAPAPLPRREEREPQRVPRPTPQRDRDKVRAP